MASHLPARFQIVQAASQLLPGEGRADLAGAHRDLHRFLCHAACDNLDFRVIARAILRTEEEPWTNSKDLFRLVLLLNKAVAVCRDKLKQRAEEREASEDFEGSDDCRDETTFKVAITLLCHTLMSTETTCISIAYCNDKEGARTEARQLIDLRDSVLKALSQLCEPLMHCQLLRLPLERRAASKLICAAAVKATVIVNGHLEQFAKPLSASALTCLSDLLWASLHICEQQDIVEFVQYLWLACQKKELSTTAITVLADWVKCLYGTDAGRELSICMVQGIVDQLQLALAKSPPAGKDAADMMCTMMELCTRLLLHIAGSGNCAAMILPYSQELLGTMHQRCAAARRHAIEIAAMVLQSCGTQLAAHMFIAILCAGLQDKDKNIKIKSLVALSLVSDTLWSIDLRCKDTELMAEHVLPALQARLSDAFSSVQKKALHVALTVCSAMSKAFKQDTLFRLSMALRPMLSIIWLILSGKIEQSAEFEDATVKVALELVKGVLAAEKSTGVKDLLSPEDLKTMLRHPTLFQEVVAAREGRSHDTWIDTLQKCSGLEVEALRERWRKHDTVARPALTNAYCKVHGSVCYLKDAPRKGNQPQLAALVDLQKTLHAIALLGTLAPLTECFEERTAILMEAIDICLQLTTTAQDPCQGDSDLCRVAQNACSCIRIALQCQLASLDAAQDLTSTSLEHLVSQLVIRYLALTSCHGAAQLVTKIIMRSATPQQSLQRLLKALAASNPFYRLGEGKSMAAIQLLGDMADAHVRAKEQLQAKLQKIFVRSEEVDNLAAQDLALQHYAEDLVRSNEPFGRLTGLLHFYSRPDVPQPLKVTVLTTMGKIALWTEPMSRQVLSTVEAALLSGKPDIQCVAIRIASSMVDNFPGSFAGLPLTIANLAINEGASSTTQACAAAHFVNLMLQDKLKASNFLGIVGAGLCSSKNVQVLKIFRYGVGAMQRMQQGLPAQHSFICELFLQTTAQWQALLAEVLLDTYLKPADRAGDFLVSPILHAFCTVNSRESRRAAAQFLQGLVPSTKNLKTLQVYLAKVEGWADAAAEQSNDNLTQEMRDGLIGFVSKFKCKEAPGNASKSNLQSAVLELLKAQDAPPKGPSVQDPDSTRLNEYKQALQAYQHCNLEQPDELTQTCMTDILLQFM